MISKVNRIHELLRRGNVWLAPMAGVTNATFRSICVDCGCPLGCTEMVSSTGLAYGSANSHLIYRPAYNERLVGVQIFGTDPFEMAKAAAAIERDLGRRLAFIDINMGCPVPKVTKRGAGSALMRTPALAADIVRKVDHAVSVPVTAKFRRGWSVQEANAVEFGLYLQEAGAAAVAVHGRTTGQLYRGAADWECIARVKEALSIPVLGNGDLHDAADVRARIDETGVDGVLIARGAQGNPWIFQQIADDRAGLPIHAPGAGERIAMLEEHARRLDAWQREVGRRPELSSLRKHAMWYLAGFPHATELRRKAAQCLTLDDFLALCGYALTRCEQRSGEFPVVHDRLPQEGRSNAPTT